MCRNWNQRQAQETHPSHLWSSESAVMAWHSLEFQKLSIPCHFLYAKANVFTCVEIRWAFSFNLVATCWLKDKKKFPLQQKLLSDWEGTMQTKETLTLSRKLQVSLGYLVNCRGQCTCVLQARHHTRSPDVLLLALTHKPCDSPPFWRSKC